MTLNESHDKTAKKLARLMQLNRLIDDSKQIADYEAFKEHLEDLRKRESAEED